MARAAPEALGARLLRALTESVDLILRGAALTAFMKLAARGIDQTSAGAWDWRLWMLWSGLILCFLLGYGFMLAGCIRFVSVMARRPGLHGGWRGRLEALGVVLMAGWLMLLVVTVFSLTLADSAGLLD